MHFPDRNRARELMLQCSIVLGTLPNQYLGSGISGITLSFQSGDICHIKRAFLENPVAVLIPSCKSTHSTHMFRNWDRNKMTKCIKTGWWFQSEKYEFVNWDDFPFPIDGKS